MSISADATEQQTRAGVERLLRPRSVAIVGASATPGALGASVLGNLERLRFSGHIHLINPNRDTIGTRPCLKSVDQLPLGVDVAILAIPRAAVLDSVRALVKRQVGAAIIFSAGFAEGGEAGLADQRELARIANESGMVIEGPNCLGLVNYVDGIALTFVETPAVALGARPGIGIVSQSGAMAAVVAATLASKSLGISYSISTGNEAASGIEDYVEYLLDDPHTQVIGLVVEQFRQARRFVELARTAQAKHKAIVLLHPGRSSAARDSAATHTGAMAGDYDVMRTKVGREGVILADTLEELGDILDIVSRCTVLPRGGSVVLAESGAFKALALDFCEEIGLPLPAITDQSAPLLRAALPAFVPVSNPIDLTAQGLVEPDLYRRAIEALINDERFGCLILAIIQTDAKTSGIKFPTIINAIRTLASTKPVVFAGLDEGAAVPEDYIAQLRALNVPYFPTSGRTFRAVARICSTSRRIQAEPGAQHRAPLTDLPPGTVAEYRSKELLASWGISFPKGELVTTVEQALGAAATLGYPIVLKAQSDLLPHKTEAGGVILNIADAAALSAGWSRLQDNIVRHRPGLSLDGVLIERMSPRGVELIIGGRTDPDWGPVVLVGFGGVQAEIMKDVRLLAPDLSVEEIVAELGLLKGSVLLHGFRGSPALDIAAVAQIVKKVGALLMADSRIKEIDLNPVIVYPSGSGALALDALIIAADLPSSSSRIADQT